MNLFQCLIVSPFLFFVQTLNHCCVCGQGQVYCNNWWICCVFKKNKWRISVLQIPWHWLFVHTDWARSFNLCLLTFNFQWAVTFIPVVDGLGVHRLISIFKQNQHKQTNQGWEWLIKLSPITLAREEKTHATVLVSSLNFKVMRAWKKKGELQFADLNVSKLSICSSCSVCGTQLLHFSSCEQDCHSDWLFYYIVSFSVFSRLTDCLFGKSDKFLFWTFLKSQIKHLFVLNVDLLWKEGKVTGVYSIFYTCVCIGVYSISYTCVCS